jgi:hypothetical protein
MTWTSLSKAKAGRRIGWGIAGEARLPVAQPVSLRRQRPPKKSIGRGGVRGFCHCCFRLGGFRCCRHLLADHGGAALAVSSSAGSDALLSRLHLVCGAGVLFGRCGGVTSRFRWRQSVGAVAVCSVFSAPMSSHDL